MSRRAWWSEQRQRSRGGIGLSLHFRPRRSRRGRLTKWSGVFCVANDSSVFSIFEEHTRWVSCLELGVPVAIIEDQYGFTSPQGPVGG